MYYYPNIVILMLALSMIPKRQLMTNAFRQWRPVVNPLLRQSSQRHMCTSDLDEANSQNVKSDYILSKDVDFLQWFVPCIALIFHCFL